MAKNDVLKISESDVHIDTLIMGDKSRIVFLALETKLVIGNAFIGENCVWDASGKSTMWALQRESGSNKSYHLDGFPGRHLLLTVMFRSLGELEIDAHGTQGRRGRSSDFINTNGSGTERGGDGGDGGIVSLIYGTAGFPIAFNEGGVRSINVNLCGGRGGNGGAPPRTTSGIGNARLPISSHNAAWNQSGNPKSTNASGEKTPDLPQPVHGTFLEGTANDLYSRTRAPGRWGRPGRPGRDGRLVLQKLD